MLIDKDDMTRYGWWHEDVDGGADKVVQKVFDNCCDYDAGELYMPLVMAMMAVLVVNRLRYERSC